MESTVVTVFGVNPFRIGGVEILAREMARQLEARRVKLVAVFSGRPQGNVETFLRAPNLAIEAIPDLEISTRASVRPLAAILRRYRPRVLHLQFVDFVGAFPWLAKLCGVGQVIFTAHGSNPENFQERRAALWKRAAVRMIDAPLSQVICVSDYARRAMVALDLLPADRFQVVYNGIALPSLDRTVEQAVGFRRRFGIPENRELVTQVSWIIAEKGVPQLLEAAQIVLRVRPNTHFAIVGNGAGEAEFRKKAEALGIAPSITWTGLLENPMEDGAYAATDVFCLASQWQESFGWVLAEAMAFEKPTVATAVGGIPEVIEDGVTGLLAKPAHDTAVLAGQLLRLLRDPELRRRMGVAGRRRVEEKFHLERNVAQLLSHYAL